jgi:hypothetical protein
VDEDLFVLVKSSSLCEHRYESIFIADSPVHEVATCHDERVGVFGRRQENLFGVAHPNHSLQVESRDEHSYTHIRR